MIPLEVLIQIIDFIPNPDLLQFVRLSQVNREFRRAFLSDLVWARFDVYGVQHKVSKPVYQYGEYKLEGIAAHFFTFWFAYNKLHAQLMLPNATFCSQGRRETTSDLYLQLYCLCDILWYAKHPGYTTNFRFIEPRVWSLWSTHLLEAGKGGKIYASAPQKARQDKQVCLALIKSTKVHRVDPTFKDDADIYLALVKHHRGSLADLALSTTLLRDKKFVIEALSSKISPEAWQVEPLCAKLINDRDVVLAAACASGYIPESDTFCDDHEIFSAAVKKDGLALEHASEALRGDYPLVLAAVKQHGRALEFASENLRDDKVIVAAAVKQDSPALEFASEALRNNREFIREAVTSSGYALRFAEAFQDDKSIVLAAVRQSGWALQFAKSLSGDREIVLAAIQESPMSLMFASEELCDDYEVVFSAVKKLGTTLECASTRLCGNRTIVETAVQTDGCALWYASQDLCNDKSIVLAAVTNRGSALEYASKALRGDKEIVLKALEEDGSALKYASQELCDDDEIVLVAAKGVGALEYASARLCGNRDLALTAFKSLAAHLETLNHSVWRAASFIQKVVVEGGALLHDRDFMLDQVAQYGKALQFASTDLRADKEVVLAAVYADPSSLAFASSALQDDPEVLEAVVART